MRVDEARSLLFVAGGPGGHAYVYDARDGSEIADLVVGPPSSLINDVAIADGVAWFTDTLNASLYRVPYGGGSFGPATTLSVTGPAGATGVGVLGLNGIDTSSDGKTLIVNHTNLGILASVDTTTGVSTQIPITGGSLMPGTLDGLQIQGRTLYVVQNFANSIVEVDLSADLSSGVVDETITSSLFQVPTTVVVSGGRLAAVNGRFDLGFPPPFGPGAPPGTTFDVVQVRK
jgi:sugar lactone lactonase YvrE